MPKGYVEEILRARVYDVAVESDLTPAVRLSARLKNNILYKREDEQQVFSSLFRCRLQSHQAISITLIKIYHLLRWKNRLYRKRLRPYFFTSEKLG